MQTTALEGMFPRHVHCVYSAEPAEHFELLPVEQEYSVTMGPLRKREFTHGRSCARAALAKLGYPDCPIAVSADRAPIWPDDVVGSISHCGNTAAAAVARRADVGGIGLDIELNDDLEEPLLPMICRREELERLGAGDMQLPMAKLLFSAKESVFKCLWPQIRRFIDFQEVEIRLDLDRKTFTAWPHTADLPPQLFQRLLGRLGQTRTLILTTAYLS